MCSCAARISAASDLRVAAQNIITIETQKEKLKQQEGPRGFLCKVSNAFRIFARHASMEAQDNETKWNYEKNEKRKKYSRFDSGHLCTNSLFFSGIAEPLAT